MGRLTAKNDRRWRHRAWVVVLAAGMLGCAQQQPAEDISPVVEQPPAARDIVAIKVYYKLDRRLTAGIHMGERWVSPKTFHSTLQPGRQATIDVRAAGINRLKMPVNINPKWKSSNTSLVTISEDQGPELVLTVRGEGEATVHISVGAISNVLHIQATYNEMAESTKVEVTQQVYF